MYRKNSKNSKKLDAQKILKNSSQQIAARNHQKATSKSRSVPVRYEKDLPKPCPGRVDGGVGSYWGGEPLNIGHFLVDNSIHFGPEMRPVRMSKSTSPRASLFAPYESLTPRKKSGRLACAPFPEAPPTSFLLKKKKTHKWLGPSTIPPLEPPLATPSEKN